MGEGGRCRCVSSSTGARTRDRGWSQGLTASVLIPLLPFAPLFQIVAGLFKEREWNECPWLTGSVVRLMMRILGCCVCPRLFCLLFWGIIIIIVVIVIIIITSGLDCEDERYCQSQWKLRTLHENKLGAKISLL